MSSGRRVATIGSALVVAAIAAYASYSHMRHLALAYGQDQAVATLLPISVDGLMVVATIALGDGRRHRWSAWLAFWAGVAASVIANVLAAQPSGVARTISAWPAIAFLLVVEVITRGGRLRSAPVTVAVTSAPSPVEVAAPLADSEAGDPWVYSEPAADRQPVTVAAPKRTPARTARRTEPRATGRPSARTKVAAAVAKTPDATPAEIAAKLRISEKTVKRHLPDRTTTPVTDSTTDKTPDTEPVNGHPVPELIDAR